MMRLRRVGGGVLVLCATLVGATAVAAEGDTAALDRPPPVRFTAGLRAGTGYAWKDGTGDVFADTPFSGGGWAALGHVSPEAGLLFPRARLFVSVSVQYQVITGTTDVYSNQGVFHARDHAAAVFQTFGWFPRDASARLQPYLSLSSGIGTIARLARNPSLTSCGPSRNQECVDTVSIGQWFLGAGAGMRARLTEHLDALLAGDARIGFEPTFDHRGYVLDVSLGASVVF